MEKKAAFSSGKLMGTRTLETEIAAIKEPDEVENFLMDFLHVTFDIDTNNEIIYINDDQDFLERLEGLEQNDAVSIHVNENFTRLYVTTANKQTFVVRINRIASNLINSFISREKPIKYACNSFAFVKWCNSKFIDLRNIYDIPTYIKLLTNDVDPFMSVGDYIKKYTKMELLEDNNEYNGILVGNFIFEFGRYLERYVFKFNLSNVCKLINENSYYEGAKLEEEGKCKIMFSYLDLEENIKEAAQDYIKQFENRAYLLSPLGRIAIKFGRTPEDVMAELYSDDIELMIMNELFNNNIKVILKQTNLYEVTCKYKSFSNAITIITAILNEIFYTMFQRKIEIKMECIVKD